MPTLARLRWRSSKINDHSQRRVALTRKRILVTVALPVFLALWWAFRPEKLWINEKVNEAAPFETSAEPQPVLTGRFEGKKDRTSGRATIYKKAPGETYLRLTDLTGPEGSEIHVVLTPSDDPTVPQSIDLGPLKTNQGDQNYDLPAAADLNKYDAVVVFDERSHAILGLAKLAPF